MKLNGTFYLLDPLFSGKPGHGMNFGGGVAKAAAKLGVDMKMAVSADISADAATHYNAVPVFSVAGQLQNVRYCGAHTDISDFLSSYNADLKMLEPALSGHDLLWDYYLLGPMQVDAYSRWLEAIPAERRPRVMAGVDVYSSTWFDWLSPIAERLRQLEPWFRVTSTSFINADKVQDELDVRTHWMPRPKMARTAADEIKDSAIHAMLAPRNGAPGPVVGYFTDPTILKSFHLLKNVIPQLLKETNLRFVLQIRHEPAEDECKESLAVLRDFAKEYPHRLMFLEGVLEYGAYKTAVEMCDGVIIAYNPASHFANTPSGTVCETLAAGTIPIAVAGTSMEKEMRLFDIDIPVLAQQSTTCFLGFLREFEANHVNWMGRNEKNIERWNQFQSHENMFQHLFEKAWQ